LISFVILIEISTIVQLHFEMLVLIKYRSSHLLSWQWLWPHPSVALNPKGLPLSNLRPDSKLPWVIPSWLFHPTAKWTPMAATLSS